MSGLLSSGAMALWVLEVFIAPPQSLRADVDSAVWTWDGARVPDGG